jgi:hypothetical protein
MQHFYHVWCGSPAWRPILAEHVAALRDTGIDWDVTVGLAGPAADRREARIWLAGALPGCHLTEANKGWEQITLAALYRWARHAPAWEPVFYAHAKGVTHPVDLSDESVFVAAWRRAMTAELLTGWQECVSSLAEFDAAGCCWLDPERFNPVFVRQVQSWRYRRVPMFGGNFWWSSAGYAARLGRPPAANRFDAELWIGLGSPRVRDMRPGWPSLDLFAAEAEQIRTERTGAS